MRVVTEAGLERHLASFPVDRPRVLTSGNFATPGRVLSIVDNALPAYRLFMLNAQSGVPDRPGVTHETPFVGPGMRHSPSLVYVPARLSLVPRLLSARHRPDVVIVHTSAPRKGMLSLGIEVNILPAGVDACRRAGGLVVAQVNRHMPFVRGDGLLPVDAVDLAVEVEMPLAGPPAGAPSEVAMAVADRLSAYVTDGSTLQVGIGSVPDAAAAAFRGRRGLRVWSEMVSDGLFGLERAGALDPRDPMVASFCFGSQELYEFVDDNPRIRLCRTELVNDPAAIARQPRMTSINSALEVDLYAQANAHRVGGRIHSGLGGQSDFVVGAMHAEDGQAIVALPSWHAKAGVSTVVARLDGPATSFQHSHLVTDSGAADIFGRSEREQARQIVGIAHPDLREELAEAAARLDLAG